MMSSTPLDYVSPDLPGPKPRWPWRTLAVAAGLLILAAAALAIPVRRVESRMDRVTGSVAWKTVWFFGVTSGKRVDVSPLEATFKGRGIPWMPSWAFLHNTHRNIFGGATCYECGSAPPILQLRSVDKQFAAASTDAELQEFVRTMQSGTDAQRKAATDSAAKKGLRTVEANP